MYAIQTSLRKHFSPHLDINTYPAHIFTTSTHNIVIERTWWHWLKTKGIWIKEQLMSDGYIYFNKYNPLHMALFEIIFFPLVRAEISEWAILHWIIWIHLSTSSTLTFVVPIRICSQNFTAVTFSWIIGSWKC
jgi:hypothetical protein